MSGCFCIFSRLRGRGTYGSPRITAELRDNGIQCGKNRIARLMKENGIKAKTKRRFTATTKSRHDLLVAENLLKRNFSTDAANKVWFSDITFILDEGRLDVSGSDP